MTAVDAAALLDERLAALSLEQKVRLLTGADFWSLHAEPAAGLRRVVVSDGPAGVRGETWDARHPSANVPTPTSLAASWDEGLAERIGRLLAVEARSKGVDVVLAPTVNLHRSPFGGRHFECFSEDPLLTGRIGAAFVRGLQHAGVGATVKHFVANDSETERFTLDARVDERTLRELYLAPFEAIVREAGAWSVMASYNGVNGATMTESPMLREVLHDEWGFDGVVMSDWFAHRSNEAAGNAALDLSMPGPAGPWGDALVAAVRAGTVDSAAVDDKVRRLLRLAARVGALDGVDGVDPTAALPSADEDDVATGLRAAAAAGFVLARNDDALLPLDAGMLGTVAVLGPNAAPGRTLGGGSATVIPPYVVSPLDGLRAALGEGRVTHCVGVRSSTRPSVAAPPLVTNPATGEPGVQALLLDDEGEVLRDEHRATGQFTTMGSFGPGVESTRVAAVELRATLRAEVGGEHLVGCSGVGPFRLGAAGRALLDTAVLDTVLLDTVLELSPGSDPAALLHPPTATVPMALAEGEDVGLVLRHDLGAGNPLGAAVFGLLVEPPHPPEEDELERAVALARDADVAVVVVGTTEEVESEGFDRTSLALPGRQDELVRRVLEANARTVVVVNAGAPVLLPWAAEVPAVLLAWFPGQEFGNALTDVLLGGVEPGGRLPTTWPATEDGLPSTTPVDGVLTYDEGLLVGHRAPERPGREPLFRFGHGLGYTTWAYEVTVPESAAAGDDIEVTVRARNTGARRGRDVVQVYASRSASAVQRPVRWLAGFAVVDADAGEEVTLTAVVASRAFAHWDVARRDWVVEPGVFRLETGANARDVRTAADLVVG